jgi:hypothetical protein
MGFLLVPHLLRFWISNLFSYYGVAQRLIAETLTGQ